MNRTSGQLIAHLGYKVGGFPFCKSRMACSVVTPENTMGYQICKRCANKLEKMKEISVKREIARSS